MMLFKSLRASPYPWGKRRMDYCVWMRIPATSRRNPTNPDKIGTQPAKKNRKNQQKSIFFTHFFTHVLTHFLTHFLTHSRALSHALSHALVSRPF